MGFGSNGAILRIDLTAGTSTVETFDEAFYRRYPGGKALAAYHLLREMPAGADPLGPDNVLVLATGLLTGAPVSTATRFNAIARSPLTGGFGESEAGGYWGPELKMAGLDAIILTAGRRDRSGSGSRTAPPRSAMHATLWGQDPPTVQAAMQGGRREERARPPDRPGGREPRPLRDAHERAAPLQRPHRHGRRDGHQERARHRGQGLAPVPRARP